MVSAQCQRQLAALRMAADGLCHGLADLGHASGVLELANWRVARDRGVDVLELVVAVEFDLPAELDELLRQARVYEVDGALVHAGFGL